MSGTTLNGAEVGIHAHRNAHTVPPEEIGVGYGLVAGKNPTKMEKEKPKEWILIDNEEPDKIKNRPDWTTEKDREVVIIEPKPPNPLEDWINKK